MALTLTQIQDRLRPFMLARVDGSVIASLNDTDFLSIYNDTANDLNDIAILNVERYNKETGSVSGESTDTTYRNYKLQGEISKILYFKYLDDDWEDQQYTYDEDRIALKDEPGDGVEMDIRYLRKCEDIADATDEVDLPDSVLPEYLTLLKEKILSDYTKEDVVYEASLRFWAEKASRKVQKHAVADIGVLGYWFRQNDDSLYDITNKWISEDHFAANASGDLIYTET